MDESNVSLMNFCHLLFVRDSMFSLFSRFLSLCLAGFLLSACEKPKLREGAPLFDPTTITDATTLRVLLEGLDANPPNQPPASQTSAQETAGYEIVSQGRSAFSGGNRLSAYFYCLDCHGLSHDDRLPGASFAGLVNRETYFNGASSDRYGDSSGARSDLVEAIQFCSTKVALGRALEAPEMDAVLAYLWSLELKVSDLSYTGADLAELKRRALNPAERTSIVTEIMEREPLGATSTLGEIPDDTATGYETGTDPVEENGGKIWAMTCLHCHDAEGASEHFFGDRNSTWERLASMFSAEGEKSLYHRLRQGSFDPAKPEAHMPLFPTERLSNTDVEDLRAYIEAQVEKD